MAIFSLRALFLSLPLVPVGLYLEVRALRVVFPAAVFVFLYSFLPHKELRFIIYAFPMLNVAAAVACARIWDSACRSARSLSGLVGVSVVVGHLLGNLVQ